MRKPFFLLSIVALLGGILGVSCQLPAIPSSPSVSRGLTITWSMDGASRTVLPSFPSASTYDLRLQPALGAAVEKKGITSSSWTFTNLTSGTFTTTITGYDAAGRVLMVGTRSFDTAALKTESVSVPLTYVISGTGTGQIHLTVTVPNTISLHSTSLQMVDPAGSITTPSLVPGPNAYTFTYANTTASVGNYQLFFRLATASLTALRVESLLVAQNVDTVGTVTFTAPEFNATYVPVTGVTLPETATVGLTGALAMTATVAPLGASNTLLRWSSDKPETATVDQNGVVTGVALGTATITVTSVDNPSHLASSTVTVKTLPITYDANGGTGIAPTDGGSYAAGDAVTVLDNTGDLVKVGFGFGGWNTKADGTGTLYAPGSTITMGNNPIVLYAFWPSALQVTYYPNEASAGDVPTVQDVLQGKSVVVSANSGLLEKTGYVFTSWNTLPTGLGTVYLPGSTLTMGSKAVSLYAFWNTVIYDPNGATGGLVPVADYPYGTGAQNITVLANSGDLTRDGYRYMGWNSKADGTGTNYAANGNTILTKPTGVLTLYAKWAPVYTTTYDANGATSGTVPVESSLPITGEKITVLGNPGTLAKTDYVFSGWNTAADGSGTQYAEGTQITLTTSPLMLYARWVPKVVAVSTNDAQGGSAHSLAITSKGELYATGYNYSGQLGDGSSVSKPRFALVQTGIQKAFAYVSMSYFLKSDRSIWVVGNGSYLGTGNINEPFPAFVVNGVDAFAPSRNGFLFLRGNSLYAVGDNSTGRFGRGNTTSATTPVLLRSDVSKVWLGDFCSVILTTDGKLLAAGSASQGALGLGLTGNVTTYTEVQGIAAIDVADIVFLSSSTYVLLKNGTVWATGYNLDGRLGLGDTVTRTAFTEVTALGTDVKTIEAGDNCLYAITQDGSLYGSGTNDGYSYGLGLSVAAGYTIQKSSPVLVLANVAAIENRTYRTFVVKTDGSLWAWGNFTYNGAGVPGGLNLSVTPQQVLF